MGRICPRASQQWRGYFTSQVYPLLVLELMALEPPFSVTVLNCRGPMSLLGDVLLLVTSYFGRCLTWATSYFSSLGPLKGPTMC